MSDERTERNQVFTAPQGPAPKPSISVDVPVEVVPLPSAGLVYPVSSPLHRRETLEIKAGTAKEEDILTSSAYLKKGTVLTELIRSCLVDKSIDPLDMLVGDRTALMFAIRITMYTDQYDVEMECGECSTKTPRTFNLSELPIRRLNIQPVAEGINLFEFLLPVTQKKVLFKFMTGRDEENVIITDQKRKKLGMGNETTVTTSLLYSIQSIDGVEDRGAIGNFVKQMPARDSLALRNYIRNNEPGIIQKQEASCPNCGHNEEVTMPMGVSFLWPAAQ